MTNIETILTKCIQEVGEKMSGCEYLMGLLKDGKKFEGWFQIEFACCLDKMLIKNDKGDVLVEHYVGNNRHADVFIKNEQEGSIAIEIKFIVKGKAIADARKSLLNQMHENAIKHHSYGVAVLVADDNKWFQEESGRITEYCKERDWVGKLCENKCNIIFSYDHPGKLFCIKLLKHARDDK